MAKSLGTLKRYSLQEYWGDAFDTFASWLIQEEVLEMIGRDISVKLLPTPQDNVAAILKGGVLAKTAHNADVVLIQGQLHDVAYHDLGQLIASAAEMNVSSIVWIASTFPAECRKAVDWLNTLSQNGGNFYCAELELWRIDNSVPAANVHVVCQPRSLVGKTKPSQECIAKPIDTKEETPPRKDEANPKSPGDWPKKVHEKFSPSQQGHTSTQVKDDVAVRENFVYTKPL
ncbi:MAG: hypothetical protein NPIRA02_40720 [Nitrospirales bacterium]|nr:MAG: hypothetical protein NPIRA02_40720 [Nitrospirales bacterium]